MSCSRKVRQSQFLPVFYTTYLDGPYLRFAGISFVFTTTVTLSFALLSLLLFLFHLWEITR